MFAFRYCEKRFIAKYLPTIGIDYGATKIYVDKRQVGLVGYFFLNRDRN